MKDLILIHGALGSKAQIEPLAKSLQSLFQTHTIQLSGHGGAEFSESGFNIETFSQELRDYIIINGLHGCDIFGYSMGGYVALKVAQANPDLLGKIFTLGTKFDWNPISVKHEIQKLNPELIEEKVPSFAKILRDRHFPNSWKMVMEKTVDLMIRLGNNPILDKAELLEITNDCLITIGDEDDMVTREESQWAVNHLHFGSLKILSQTSHPIEEIDTELLVAELVNFFE